ncbi:hypothetical protein HT585_05470 [Ensifer sp. HO-A22]|uniref:Uncharacterized protein n=1 Tax=Ensifer oleiphilus TaxID=2742698 RepID=A0A7Y6ULN7_9HYPH|nr:hypothetical protein [Ensifer oleiphilus]NVD38295.1 hypothetical protein [Ensifer oleiphilus]
MLLALALLTSLLTDQHLLPNPQGNNAVPDYFNNRSDQPVVPNPQGNKAIPDYFKNSPMGGGQPGVTICNLNGQDMRGQFKICRYDCGTEITIDQRVVCPFIQQR